GNLGKLGNSPPPGAAQGHALCRGQRQGPRLRLQAGCQAAHEDRGLVMARDKQKSLGRLSKPLLTCIDRTGGCSFKTTRRCAEGHAEPVRVEVTMLTNSLYVGATLLPHGKGRRLTAQLGEVMGESARAAQSFVWSRADALDIDPDHFRDAGV